MNGDNAVVCKAEFLHLPCAAKYVHQKLRESSTWQMTKFLRGCKILEKCRHPNIIPFLGMYYDDTQVAPILLMELMDQSLKDFLDRARLPVPRYLQFDFCNDIAQGMDYLHAKKIIHGDLTATNVLVQGGRAKICGVISLQHNVPGAELEQCPGTSECLPLQVLTSSDYDEKIDCFSFGVLTIHIATRQTPRPRPLALQSNKTISETERYKSSLEMVNDTHPLRQIIIECLSNEPDKRPSAAKLCSQLSEMKSSSDHRNSLKTDQICSEVLSLKIKQMRKEIDKETSKSEELRKELEEKETESQQQREEVIQHQQAQGKLQKAIEDKQNTIAMLTLSNEDLDKKAEAASEKLAKTRKEVEEYKRQLEDTRKYRTELKDVKESLQKEREKTETMESKIKELKSAKDDYKEKFEESDRNFARLLSQQDRD